MKHPPEMKLLIAVYGKSVFEGKILRQEIPRCCNKVIDLFSTDVEFKDVTIGNKTFTLLEPVCPTCGKKVKALYHIVH